MQISGSPINLIRNSNRDTASMIRDWLGAVLKLNKMTVGLFHAPRDWQWQISGGNEEIIAGRYETLRIE